MKPFYLFCILTTLAVTAPVTGYVNEPTSRPVTQPATGPAVALDQATPQGAVTSYYAALSMGDAAAIGILLDGGDNPGAEDHVAALARFAAAQYRVDNAFKNAFGRQINASTGVSTPDPVVVPETAVRALSGTYCLVLVNGNSSPIPVVKKEGKWRIDFSDVVALVSPEMRPAFIRTGDAQIRALDAVATQIAAGDFATPEDAEAAVVRMRAEAIDAAMREERSRTSESSDER